MLGAQGGSSLPSEGSLWKLRGSVVLGPRSADSGSVQLDQVPCPQCVRRGHFVPWGHLFPQHQHQHHKAFRTLPSVVCPRRSAHCPDQAFPQNTPVGLTVYPASTRTMHVEGDEDGAGLAGSG